MQFLLDGYKTWTTYGRGKFLLGKDYMVVETALNKEVLNDIFNEEIRLKQERGKLDQEKEKLDLAFKKNAISLAKLDKDKCENGFHEMMWTDESNGAYCCKTCGRYW